MAHLHVIESRFDTQLAARFVERLEALGHTLSIDSSFLIAGVEWNRALRGAVLRADGLLAVLTTNSVDKKSHRITSQWIAADIGAARATGKFIIPVLVGHDCPIPTLIDDIYVLQLADPEDPRQLRRVIDQVSDAVAEHVARRARETALELPPGYEHLASSVLRCRKDGTYEKSVFVMMKFPSQSAMEPKEVRLLTDIWETLEAELGKYGLIARRADQRAYADDLWENICVYMLSSHYGIAILEDRVAQELNPNVALEYGFMKAFNRRVALFREIHFEHDRADLTGKLSTPFEIERGVLNKASLRAAVAKWWRDVGASARRSRRNVRR